MEAYDLEVRELKEVIEPMAADLRENTITLNNLIKDVKKEQWLGWIKGFVIGLVTGVASSYLVWFLTKNSR